LLLKDSCIFSDNFDVTKLFFFPLLLASSVLRKNFDDVRASHVAAVQEKEDLEKKEREKAQWFRNVLSRKLAELQRDTELSVAALGG
jgi:hypothetical protein